MTMQFDDCLAQVVWIARHRHIGDAFFDVDAAQFLLEQLHSSRGEQVRCCEYVDTGNVLISQAAFAHAVCMLHEQWLSVCQKACS